MRRLAVVPVLVLALAGCTGDDGATVVPATAAGTTVTLEPVLAAGAPAPEGFQLDAAAKAVRARLVADGVSSARAERRGGRIVVTVPPSAVDAVSAATVPGRLELRPVIADFPEPNPGGYPGVAPGDLRLLTATDCRAAALPAPTARAVACDDTSKYLLDAAVLTGTVVESATATLTSGSGHGVEITWTAAGQALFTSYTGRHNEAVAPGDPANRLAFVLDGRVLSAPTVQDRITGTVQISGSYTPDTARRLAALIGSGALPFPLRVVR